MADDKEKELRKRFTEDLETGKRFMDPIHLLMDKYYEQYRNRNQLDKDDQKFKVSDLYGYVETVVPILTNNRVRAAVKSDYPDYVRHAQGLTDILDHSYDINNWDYEAQEIARMGEIYRSSLAYTGFDGDYKNGTGKLCIYGCNIRWCYLDPAAAKFEDSSFFFYAEPKRKTEVIKLHPDKKSEVEQTIGKRDALEKTDSKVRRWFQTFFSSIKNAFITASPPTTMPNMSFSEMAELDEEEKHKNSVAYIHYWYRDDEDKWRVSYWADEVFLEDTDNPFWHGRLPYDIYNPTKDILSSMGIPMAEHIENLNWEKNTLMNLFIRHGEKLVDPVLIYNTTAGIKDPLSLKEKAKEGLVPINNPDMVPLNAIADYFTPPPIPGYVDSLIDRYQGMEDRITGVNDSFRGMSEATSGKEVQLKQEAAYTRIKTKIDNFELFNKSIAEKVIVNAMQFYDKTRAFRIKGDYTQYQTQSKQELPFKIKQIQTGMDEQGEPVYDRSEYYLYANPNEWTKLEGDDEVSNEGNQTAPNGSPNPELSEQQAETGEEDKQESEHTEQTVQRAYRILQMTVEIEAGSSLPQSRMARREEALELAKDGFIDQEAVLEAYDWPNRDDIMKRMKEVAQAQQQAQMEQAQIQAEQQAQQKQAQGEQQMQMKQMEMQHQQGLAQMKQQPQPNLPDVAGGLDKIRQAVPELANMSDEQLAQLVAQMRVAS